MFSSIRKFLNGFTSMTSEKSGEKEKKVLNFKTNIPALDKENAVLIRASGILESIGNDPGVTATAFIERLILSDNTPVDDLDQESIRQLTLAAVSIETMMTLEVRGESLLDPTIH